MPGSEAAARGAAPVPEGGWWKGPPGGAFPAPRRRAKAMARKNLASAQVTEAGRAPPAPGAQRRVQGGEGGGAGARQTGPGEAAGFVSSGKYGCGPRALWPPCGRIDTWSDAAAGCADAAWRMVGAGEEGLVETTGGGVVLRTRVELFGQKV